MRRFTRMRFFQCKVTAHVNGRTYEGFAKVAYAPEKIVATTQLPEDFNRLM